MQSGFKKGLLAGIETFGRGMYIRISPLTACYVSGQAEEIYSAIIG